METLDPAGEVWVNGEVAAVLNGRIPREIEIGPYLIPGRENTIAVERPVEFQIFPKEPSEEFSTSNALSAFIQCIIGTGDAVQMWEDTLDQMRADGLAEYIERQNEAYRAWQGERDTTVSESSKTGAGEETAEEPTISQ